MNSGYSLLGAFVFLAIGIVLQALLQRLLYPFLSAAHEKNRFAGRQTVAPSRIMFLMRLVNFLMLPLVGFLAGAAVFGR
jgi:hypothetical protein